MPSIDEDLLVALAESGKLMCLAEQNNGYILQNLLSVLYRRGVTAAGGPSCWRSTRSTRTAGRTSSIPAPTKS